MLPGNEARKLKVFEAARNRRRAGPPGVVIEANPRGILVGSGSGAVLLRRVQMEGRRSMAAREFLLGMNLAPGMAFDPQ